MPEPRPDGMPEPPPGPARDAAGAGPRGHPRIGVALVLVGAIALAAVVVATGLSTGPRTAPVVGSPAAVPSGTPSAAPLIAIVDEGGSLATMDARGGSVTAYTVPAVSFGFPTWSPDGSRIAAVGSTPDDAAIYVFTVQRGDPAGATRPIVIYRSPNRPPFYLYWTPDSRRVAFLATEPTGISLRTAPADGSAQPGGSAPGSIVRQGSPLYFDWEGADRLLLHVGDGPSAFIGEVGLDGASLGPPIRGAGDFRAASASRDGMYVAYVRSEANSADEIVVASRDGASRQALPVFGPAAFSFDPTGNALAAIAADAPATLAGFPIGPLRLIEPGSGSTRTLLGGSVIGFFWAPDGRTIAALRLAPRGTPTADAGSFVTAGVGAPSVAAATPEPPIEVRLSFVDVASGVVRSERVVQPGSLFVSQILPFFDQYALSHRVWAPDSASIVLPLVAPDGSTKLEVIPADGSDSHSIASGTGGFWSP